MLLQIIHVEDTLGDNTAAGKVTQSQAVAGEAYG
jgi:hypothetical protein